MERKCKASAEPPILYFGPHYAFQLFFQINKRSVIGYLFLLISLNEHMILLLLFVILLSVGHTNLFVRLPNLSVRLNLFVCYDLFGYFCNVLKVENLNLI